MREPVIEDNAADHAQFCKYAADLLERVTGKSLATSSAVPSLSRITKVSKQEVNFRRTSLNFCDDDGLSSIEAPQIRTKKN